MSQYIKMHTPTVNMVTLLRWLFSLPLYTCSSHPIDKCSRVFDNVARNNAQPYPGNYPRTQQAKAVSEKELNISYIIPKGVNNGF